MGHLVSCNVSIYQFAYQLKPFPNIGTAHTTQSVISARCIHLTIMRIITNATMGYDFVGSVDMADIEEGEMPVTFYRRRWGTSTRAVWSMPSENSD